MSILFMNLMVKQLKEAQTFLLTFPRKAGRIARDEFVLNFKRQGYIDQGGNFHKWQPRKITHRYRRTGVTGKKSSKLRLTRAGKNDQGRAILVGKGSGKLRRDINIGAMTSDSVTIITSTTTQKYAQVHNEGLKSGRGKGFTMPKRPFMVASKNIDDQIRAYVESGLNKIFNAR